MPDQPGMPSSPLGDLPDPLEIEPLHAPFDVTLRPPASKSLTCRAYVLAALSAGATRVLRPLRADDTDRLLAALTTLGARVTWMDVDAVIDGVGGRFPRGGVVDLGDGGTPTRFMIAAACLACEPVVVDGSRRMRERPVAEGVDLLRRLGAKIAYVEQPGRLPVRVTPARRLTGGELDVPTTLSSQFISALLLIAPFLDGGLSVRYTGVLTSPSYVELTIDSLRAAGVTCSASVAEGGRPVCHRVEPGCPAGHAVTIEPDASSAAYWFAAAAIHPGSRVTIPDLPRTSTQPDIAVPRVLARGGAILTDTRDGLTLAASRELSDLSADCTRAPDGALAIAAAASRCRGRTTLSGLATLRVKETDRIAALAAELSKVGACVTATRDTLAIEPCVATAEPVTIATYNDHRMAMSFAVLGLVRPGISIANPGCVVKSYPTFWDDLARFGR